jgi:hypothetical protein
LRGARLLTGSRMACAGERVNAVCLWGRHAAALRVCNFVRLCVPLPCWQNDSATPLCIASQKGYLTVVLALLAAGADPTIPWVRSKHPCVCHGGSCGAPCADKQARQQ